MKLTASLSLLWRDWNTRFGIVILVTLVIVSVFANQLAPYGPDQGDFRLRVYLRPGFREAQLRICSALINSARTF